MEALPGLLLLLGTPAALGACCACVLGLRAREDVPAFAAKAWLLGAFLLAALLFLGLVAGVPLPVLRWVPPGALAILVPWALRARRDRPATAAARRPGHGLWLAVTAACLLATIDRIVRADEAIVCFSDEGHIWNVKARAIWEGGGFTPEFRALVSEPDAPAPQLTFPHRDYPLQNPLLQLWSFLCAGDVTLWQCRLVIQPFALALILLLAAALRRVAPPVVAAAAVALVALSGSFQAACETATADMMVAFGLCASLDAWSRYRAAGERRHLAVFAISLASLAWSKNEGMVLAGLAGAACVATDFRAAGSGRTARMLALLPAATVIVGQAAFNAWCDVHSDILAVTPQGSFLTRVATQAAANLPVIGRYLLEVGVLQPRATNLVPLLAVAAFVLFPVRLLRRMPAATLTLLGAAAAYLVVYLGTPRFVDWHLQFSLDRVLLHVTPLAALWLAAAVATLWRPERVHERLE